MGKANQQNPLGEDAVSDYVPQNSGALGVAPSGTPGDEFNPFILGGSNLPPGSVNNSTGVQARPVVIGGAPHPENPYPYVPPPAYQPPFVMGGSNLPPGSVDNSTGVKAAPVKIYPNGPPPGVQTGPGPSPAAKAKIDARLGPRSPTYQPPAPPPPTTPSPAALEKIKGRRG